MNGHEEGRCLLSMSRKDFRAAQGMLNAAQFDDEVFGFHIQQAAEKAAKAWLASFGQAFPPTHDLTRLFTLLSDCGVDCENHFSLVEFNAFAVQYRYEAFDDLSDLINRENALARVDRLLMAVAKAMEGEEGV